MAKWGAESKSEKSAKAVKDAAREAELERRKAFGSQPDAIPLITKLEKGSAVPANFNLK